jgi:hypothetical protein
MIIADLLKSKNKIIAQGLPLEYEALAENYDALHNCFCHHV